MQIVKQFNFLLLLFYFSCTPPKPVEKISDTKPEEPLTIKISPKNNSILSEKVKINASVNYINRINEIQFYINDSILFIDNSFPYYYQWNTSYSEDDSKHSVFVSVLTKSGKNIQSDTLNYKINNVKSRPKENNIISVNYNKKEMKIHWNKSTESDFHKYELLHSKKYNTEKRKINEFNQNIITTHIIKNFNPTIENWYWIKTIDTVGLYSIGEGLSNKIDIPPKPSKLNPIEYNSGDYYISWTKNQDNDFNNYLLYESNSKSFFKKKLISQIDNINKNRIIVSIDTTKYFQIITQDHWNLEIASNIILGDYKHKIWNKKYSVVNTIKIDLSSEKLTNSIPKSIGYLKNLTQLSLNANFLSGTIPSEIGLLNKLTFLDLSHNEDLNGEIPPELGKIKNLRQLYINNTNISGNIPISIFYLKNLTHLGLSNNKLNGNLPYEIGKLTNLTYLNLWNNNFNGSIPKEIGNLINLVHLNLSENNFINKIPKEIDNLINLETIGLFNNHIEGDISLILRNLKNLSYISIYNNKLTGDLTSLLSELNKLYYLRIDENNFSGKVPAILCNLDIDFNNTEYFNISNNNLCPPFPDCIKNNIGIQKNCE